MRTRLVAAVLLALSPAVAAAPKKKKKPPVQAVPAPDPEPVPAPEPPKDTTPKPWAEGISEEHQKQASALYEEGNTLFAQGAHLPALEKYRAAVEIWDHPLIQLNLAVTLIRLDRVLEAAHALDRALRFGEAPYKPELYQQATDYQHLIQGRVGHIEVTCDEQGASVLLDGKRWFSCPGKQQMRVLAGEHTLVGERQGFLTSSERLVVAGGKTMAKQIKLVPLESAITLEYRYRRWIPWTITVTGILVAAGGAGVWFAGKNQMDEFDANFERECLTTGCEKDLSQHPLLRDQRDSAMLKGKIGAGVMIGGGAIALGGLIFVIVNRPKQVLPNVEVAPVAGGGAAATVGWTF